jgi:oxygen-independent coproporphyrinogen-3 oxidase
MAGLYFHIPYCKQACHYCDFHFSTNTASLPRMVTAICRELELRKNYLPGEEIKTIYFGGGTPSLLPVQSLQAIFDTVYHHYRVSPEAEITLEANPDDLTQDKIQELKELSINRLSIGTQSFHGPHLSLMNRAHNSQEALHSIRTAQEAGFRNISIDLIYGIPAPDHTLWRQDLAQLFALNVQHVSCYALTVEPQTVLGNWTKKGKFKPAEDEFTAQQFEILLEEMTKHGFIQYEISNFCLPGFESKHNSSYWKSVNYLGIGPSAHSFNGHSRQFNVAHNFQYLDALERNELPFTLENLSLEDQANEYLLTTLRTIWGTDLGYLKNQFGLDLLVSQGDYLAELQRKNLVEIKENNLRLTDSGKLLADQIALDLFVLKED